MTAGSTAWGALTRGWTARRAGATGTTPSGSATTSTRGSARDGLSGALGHAGGRPDTGRRRRRRPRADRRRLDADRQPDGGDGRGPGDPTGQPQRLRRQLDGYDGGDDAPVAGPGDAGVHAGRGAQRPRVRRGLPGGVDGG